MTWGIFDLKQYGGEEAYRKLGRTTSILNFRRLQSIIEGSIPVRVPQLSSGCERQAFERYSSGVA